MRADDDLGASGKSPAVVEIHDRSECLVVGATGIAVYRDRVGSAGETGRSSHSPSGSVATAGQPRLQMRMRLSAPI